MNKLFLCAIISYTSLFLCQHLVDVQAVQECAVAGDKRQNCGWGGITAQQCENEGCCFDSSIRGVPWCFHGRAREECAVAGDKRQNCGWGGITAQQCENEGCCFDSSIRGVPWCFHGKPTDEKPNPTSGAEVNGGYSQWGYWTRCSVTCSTGQRSRTRSCTNPPPSSGGKDCSGLGPATQTEKCYRGSCLGFGCETRSIKRIIFYLTKPGQTCKEGCKEDGKNCEDYGKPDFLYHNANPFEYFRLECSKKVPYDTNYDDTKDGDNTNDVEAYDPATKICYGYTDKSVYNSKCDRKPADPTWKRLCMCDFWEKKTYCPGDIGYYGK